MTAWLPPPAPRAAPGFTVGPPQAYVVEYGNPGGARDGVALFGVPGRDYYDSQQSPTAGQQRVTASSVPAQLTGTPGAEWTLSWDDPPSDMSYKLALFGPAASLGTADEIAALADQLVVLPN